MVQAFVRGRRATRTRTTAVDVVVFLREICVLDFDLEDKKVYSLHLRSVQRFLKYQGYERGNKKGLSSYHLSKKNTVARDLYVQRMHPHVGSASRPTIVYTDESFIHHHYKCHNQSLYDPSDVLDVAPKEKHKGRRYCFIAAILDSPTMDSRVMALDIFTGGTTLANEPKDYHGMFNHAYYVGWFQRLLDELDEIRVSNALIVMGNAKYHKGRPSNTPQSRHRKEVLIAACKAYGIPVTGTEFKSLLWEKLAAYIETNVLSVVMTMASERGHTVVYTPPHHSDLQPIEMIWALVKGDVGRQYTDMTKFPEVKTRLVAAFAKLTPHAIKGCVKVAEGSLHMLHEHLQRIDRLESDEESSAGSESDDGGSDSD
ncbi:hypothetical protein DYB28_008742 [Aphanomyces astaci]|uniref:Tc1-like transposase DDE domain-containing protein n=1 Tax=Aphanomyces astaci TaxID=112090 RepID=A0A397EPX3_APHAT|nr:hypothetical protein DYB34_008962 [Aphanomyces astaci]RHY87079.1 hypothetical protein DYB31_016467 [Aphanomyces astaci]RHZ15943.1 hypothetical protein DYB26_003585 [Aphanomyces astaci]RLO08194.1 hypothetical protein DYB28_008742 [Aphanomyces astaci]